MFGIGGMAIVYIAAPLLDNRIREMKKQILIWSCLALLCLYAADSAYSAVHPNEGKGITDYNDASVRGMEYETIHIYVCRKTRDMLY